MPTPILQDHFVEAVARALCQEAGHDLETVVVIEGAKVIIGGVEQPGELKGPRWWTFAQEACDKLDAAQKRMAAQIIRTPGRA